MSTTTKGGCYYYTRWINKQNAQMKGMNYVNKGNKRCCSNNNQQRRVNTSTSYTRNDNNNNNSNKCVTKRAVSSYARCNYSYNGSKIYHYQQHQPYTTRVNNSYCINMYTPSSSSSHAHSRNECHTPRGIGKCKSYRYIAQHYASMNKQLTRCTRSTTQPIKQSRSYGYINNSGSKCESYNNKYKLNTYRNYYINNVNCSKNNNNNNNNNNGKECCSLRNSNLNTTLSKSKGVDGFTVEGYKTKIDSVEELHFFYVYVIQNGSSNIQL